MVLMLVSCDQFVRRLIRCLLVQADTFDIDRDVIRLLVHF